MSMLRKIFKPGAGQVHQRFIVAYLNGASNYRGDLVIWDTTAPTSQGASGVLRGETLGSNDFIFVKSDDTANNKVGLQAGIIEGKAVGDRDTVNALANDDICVVQTYGVHTQIFCLDDTVAAGAILTTESTEAGSVADVAVTTVVGTDSTQGVGTLVGVALAADTTFTRGTATQECVTGFVRCDF